MRGSSPRVNLINRIERPFPCTLSRFEAQHPWNLINRIESSVNAMGSGITTFSLLVIVTGCAMCIFFSTLTTSYFALQTRHVSGEYIGASRHVPHLMQYHVPKVEASPINYFY